MRAAERMLAIYVSDEQLELLKKLDYPCSEEVLASATPTEEGIELTGTRIDFDSLAGWVAGEANHADRRARRKIAMLHDLWEQLEAALASGSRTW
jgi:hypothetical protein